MPGGQPTGGRSLSAGAFDLTQLGEWASRITTFPADWSNVGFDAESRARACTRRWTKYPGRAVRSRGRADRRGLLKGLLDSGVSIHTNARATELIVDSGEVTGVRIGPSTNVRARHSMVWERAASNGIPF